MILNEPTCHHKGETTATCPIDGTVFKSYVVNGHQKVYCSSPCQRRGVSRRAEARLRAYARLGRERLEARDLAKGLYYENIDFTGILYGDDEITSWVSRFTEPVEGHSLVPVIQYPPTVS